MRTRRKQIDLPATFCWLVFFLFLAAATPGPAADKSAKVLLENFLKGLGYESIPLKRDEDNQLIATGKLEGKTADFLIDTGWSLTTVDRSIGSKLKTLKQLGVTLEDPYFGTMTNDSITLINVVLGSAIFTNQPAKTKTLDLGGSSIGDCVLGLDFLMRNFCLIDCFEKRLYVRGSEPSPKVQEVLAESLRRGGFHEINCSSSGLALLIIDTRINSEPAKLAVDTGASFSVLESTHLKRFHMDKKNLYWLRGVGVGSIGSTRFHASKVERLELGNLSLTNVDFEVADLSGWKIGKAGTDSEDIDGLLGALELRNCHGLIDCRAEKLWMRPPLNEFLRSAPAK